MKEKILNIINLFESVSLSDMDSISLMKRKDSKYIFNISLLPKVLEELKDDYKVLEIKNQRLLKYNTCYYDTPNLDLYHFHHNQKLNRFKVREREYDISKDLFLEVKRKNNKKVTDKKRTRLNQKKKDFDATNNNTQFIKQHTDLDIDSLEKMLNNSFYRITLANFKNKARLTIDLFLRFYDNDKSKSLDKLVIAELKQDAYNKSATTVQNTLKKLGIRPNRISKYCIGTVLLNDEVKYNRFKPKLLILNKICDGELNLK